MSQLIPERTAFQARQTNKTPNLVLKVDGIEEAFGSLDVFTFIRYGENAIRFGEGDIVYGGITIDLASQDAVDLTGSTTVITQQLVQDRGSVQSVTNIDIEIQDPKGELTEAFNDQTFTQDILGRPAELSYMFQGGSYPEESIVLLSGVISGIKYLPTTIKIKLSHPIQYLRQRIAEPINGELLVNIDDFQTEGIEVSGNFLQSSFVGSGLRTYVQINDELIEYETITNGVLQNVTRGVRRTVSDEHEIEDEVTSVYTLEGNGIDIALKLLLSQPVGGSIETLTPSAFVDAKESGFIDNSVFFFRRNLERELGIVEGDIFILASVPPASPFIVSGEIQLVGTNDSGTFVVLDFDTSTLPESPEDYIIEFRSRFDVLPFGLGLRPSQVDISTFLEIQSIFSADFPEMEIYVKDAIQATDFIAKEIMVPNGLYLIPKRGKVSIGRTTPPISSLGTIELNEDNIVNPQNIRIDRSINKNFYNAVIYKYDENTLDNTLINNLAVLSADSVNRIRFPNNPLVIEAGGFRRAIGGTDGLINRQALAYLDRYKFGAEEISNVQVTVEAGFNIDVGDTVIFGSDLLNLSDSRSGSKAFGLRVMEVVNKRFPLDGSAITLTLLDTSFAVSGRYGQISPSSFIQEASGFTLTLEPSFGQNPIIGEAEKWRRQERQRVKLRSADFQEEFENVIIRTVGSNQVVLRDQIPVEVEAGFILEIADYDDNARNRNKAVFAYFNPSVNIVSGTSQTVFTVDDASDLFIGTTIYVTQNDYADRSDDVTITDIDGNEITVSSELGFIPDDGDTVELIGFIEDNGRPYRIL